MTEKGSLNQFKEIFKKLCCETNVKDFLSFYVKKL